MTSQLANKMMMKEDGSSPGTVDQGARGMMMMPQLGSVYLPSDRFHRVILSLESPTAGTMYLLSNTNTSPRSNAQRMVQKETYTFPQVST